MTRRFSNAENVYISWFHYIYWFISVLNSVENWQYLIFNIFADHTINTRINQVEIFTKDIDIPVKLPWIFPGDILKANEAPGNIQGNVTALLIHAWKNIMR